MACGDLPETTITSAVVATPPTGTKLSSAYAVLVSSGSTTSAFGVLTSRVWPSGCARATCETPMAPPAPARFSTTTDWPSASPSAGARVRATTSRLPPGAKGTTSVTGFCGNFCARAGDASARAVSAAEGGAGHAAELLLHHRIVSFFGRFSSGPASARLQSRKPGSSRSSLRSSAGHSIRPYGRRVPGW